MSKSIFYIAFLSTVLTGCQLFSPYQSSDPLAQESNNEDGTFLEFIDENGDIVFADQDNSIADTSPLYIEEEPVVEDIVVSVEEEKPAPPIDLWQRMRSGFALDLESNNSRIASQLKWLVSHPDYLDRVTKRGSRYLYFIVEELEKAELPLEFALLPIAESGFDPFGYSHARASGPWQFIPSTGRYYGLEQDWWYDGRRDIVSSTRAAIAYLTNLNKMFNGNWLHAIAAYNSGEGTVLKAIRKNKKLGKPTDFWSLSLPRETRAYVPKLLALGKMFKNPESYNYKLLDLANKPYFEIVNIGGQIDLAQAAQMADISIDEVYLLNPGFNQWATSPTGPHRLLIPVNKASAFRSKLASASDNQRVTWVRYVVKSGDNLALIAKRHNTTVGVIEDVNKMSSTIIRVGQQLMIPVAGSSIESYTLSSHQRLLAKQKRTSKGRVKVTYTVKPGDSFWKISRKYNTTSKQLAYWNNMSLKSPLIVGKTLTIWLNTKQNSVPSNANTGGRSLTKKLVYVIRSGDSVAKVANKFNVTVSDIMKWNPKVTSKKYIQPGDRLTLLVNVLGG